jgi:hypothetical protein
MMRMTARRVKDRLTRLEEETAAYYDSLTEADKRDDAEWVEFATKSYRTLHIDDGWPAIGVPA